MTSLFKSSNPLTELSSLTGPQWVALGMRHAPQYVTGAAIIGLAWQAARLTWLFLTPVTPTVAMPSAAPPGLLQAAGQAAVNSQRIADAHLFGVVNATTEADPNSLPQTQMSLVLAGTMALEDPEAGYAILGENAASAKFYRAGTVMAGGARLHAVYADRVIIDRNGVLETLLLPRGVASNAPPPTARNVTMTNPVGDSLRRLANNNPSALGELLRAQPVFSDGVQKGYRVYPGRDRQQFIRLGLMPGDLVTAINGSSLDDPSRGGEILNTLVSSSTAQVTVERNGATQQLSLDMAQISLPEAGADNSSSSSEPASSGAGFNGPPRGQRNLRNGTPPTGTPSGASAQ